MQEQKSSPASKQSEPEDKFTVKAPQVSLPKGGGAIRGMGEKFAANPVTGTGSMSIPIATSPGRGGFGPQLSLSYDSGSGNGPFGLGWNLSLPAITRKTDKGVPQYQDENESDVFILSGAEDLVPVLVKQGSKWVYESTPDRVIDAIKYKIRRYRPRIEGMFARIERWTDQSGVSHWRTISKDNITTLYGRSDESCIVDPKDATRIFSWMICESYDDKGNAIRYEYKSENSQGIDRANANEANRTDSGRAANRYIKRIKYGNQKPRKANEDLSKRDDWMFEAVFDYGEHYAELNGEVQPVHYTDDQRAWDRRQDPFSSYRAGYEVRTYRLCQRVLMFHHFAELHEHDYLVRATHFQHSQNPIASFITGVTQSGYQLIGNQYQKRSLPPVEFEYSPAVIEETVHEVDAASLENLPQGLDNSRYQWVDLDGEGLSGILTEQGGAWFYKRNQSAVPVKDNAGKEITVAKFAPLERVATMPSTANLSGGQQLLDLDGNGQLDVVEFDGPAPGFFERTTNEGWETHRPFTSLPNVAWQDPNLKFIDLTGDGHADILVSEDEAFSWYPSLAEAGFGPGEKVRQAIDEEKGPRLVFADGTQSIYLADMSGDGLTDLVRIRNGEVCYWPNLGYARFGAKVTMDKAPWFDNPDQFNHQRIRLADIDGSGVVDILYLTAIGVHLYFNQSGNAWSERRTVSTFPRIDNLSAVSTLDLLGNGTACLVWSSPLPGEARSTLRYVDLMGGLKPHLLIKTKNNLGAETKIEYAASTRFYLQDKQAGTPWITKLPFPVHVVTKSTVTDKWRNTKFSSTYSYHHGYFDGVEREFRGFARVEQIDSEGYLDFAKGNIDSPNITQDQLLYQPPIKTITWYHTGAAFERDGILTALKKEYFPIEGFIEHLLPEPTLTPSDLSAEEWREAVRACKGMVLRQEVFELDAAAFAQGTHKRVRLYTTAYHNNNIKRLQPQGDNRHAVFLVTESEAITYHYELDLRPPIANPDPRIAHSLNLRFDGYGRALQTVAVVYPRRVPYTPPVNTLTLEQRELIRAVQGERHIAYTETHFTRELDPDPNQHRLPAPCEVITYELTGDDSAHGLVPSADGYFTLNDLRAFKLSDTLNDQGVKHVASLDYHQQPVNQNAHKRSVEWVRMLYFNDALSNSQPFGEYAWHGLPYETYKLALTSDLLNAIFTEGSQNKLDQAATGTTTPRQLLNNADVSGYLSGAGLVTRFLPQVPAADLAGQYWIRSGTAGFERDAKQHFYLPELYTDPFGNVTTLAYDGKYYLFIQSSTDAMGNTSGIATERTNPADPSTERPRFDYRVLAPIEMMDANGNHSEVAFDILGMVVAAAIKGKNISTDPAIEKWEGDDLSNFNYDLCNPSSASVQAFCFNTAGDRTQARQWLDHATTRFVYHFGDKNGQWAQRMAGACGIVRERHQPQVDVDLEPVIDIKNPIQIALECSDGSSNVLMKKVQAEPDPTLPLAQQKMRWIVNGLTVLNNKGKPVKQYEPAFSAGFGCEIPQANGATTIIYYDAAGRVVRTEMPDGTFSRVEFSPWHVKTFDANDTAFDSDSNSPVHSDWYKRRTDPAHPLFADFNTPENSRAARLAAAHTHTPSQTHLDSLGREVIAIAHNRTPDVGGVWRDAFHTTFTKLDAEGKPLWICDARGNLVMQYITPSKPNHTPLFDDPNPDWRPAYDMLPNAVPCYDIAGNLLFQHSMDAGDRWMLMDAAGKPMLAWDYNDRQDGTATYEEQRLYVTDYDALHRPTANRLHVLRRPKGSTQAFAPQPPITLERFEYQDGVATDTRNLNGQLTHHYDPSGLLQTVRRDFKGNVQEIRRTLVKDTRVSHVDWTARPTANDARLETETYIQITEHDALNRMTRLFNWHRASQPVAVYEPRYNARGLLHSETLRVRATKSANGYVSNSGKLANAIMEIRYNAKGQKTWLELGNGTVTHYTYDKYTFRLVSLYTRRDARFTTDCGATPPPPRTAAPDTDNPPRSCGVQNLHYTYDPVGNITHIRDDAQQTIFFKNAVVEPSCNYTYDALYRLIEATGREQANAPAPSIPESDWPQLEIPTDTTLSRYTQRYVYDEVGNFVRMEHEAADNSWKQHYKTASDSNRLLRTWQGNASWSSTGAKQKVTYQYDPHGSMLNLGATPTKFKLQWDHRDMIRTINLGGGGTAYYQYDNGKQRIRKRIENQNGLGGYWERIYLGGYERYRRYNGNGSTLVEEIESHHLFEGEQRVLLVDDVITSSGTMYPRPDGLTVKLQTLFRYQYSNHLGSACLELDHAAEIISYEEYHPYGTSAYRVMKSGIEAPAKRYRYTGMERDEESGLCYHHARYYFTSIAGWISSDPLFEQGGINFYSYAAKNSILHIDRDGMQEVPSVYVDYEPQQAAADAVLKMMDDRRAELKAGKRASSAGSQSGEFDDADRQIMTDGFVMPNKRGVTPTNCAEFVFTGGEKYFSLIGKEDPAVYFARDASGRSVVPDQAESVESGRLTAYIRALHQSGEAETIHLQLQPDSDVAVGQLKSAVDKSGHYPSSAVPIRGNKSGDSLDVRVPVDHSVTKFPKNTKSQDVGKNVIAQLEKSSFEVTMRKLENTPFAWGTVDAGNHGFLILKGKAYEVHWNASSRSLNLYEGTPLRKFLADYGSAVIAVPRRNEKP